MKLIKLQSLLIIIFVSISSLTSAQNIDDIITKHIKAHGDLEKWDSVQSMKITGRFTAFSVEEDFYAVKTNTGGYYSDLYLGQFKVFEAFNGKTGWTDDPWQELGFPRKLNKTEINVFYQKAEFFSPFYKYKEKGLTVELLGKEKIEGIEMFIIKLTRPNGKIETWYLNTKTYLEYKYESEWVDFAYRTNAETYFDDFRTVDGLVIPFYTERTFGQRNRILQLENVEFNVKVDESKYEMPRSTEMKKLSFLEGEWDVKIEIMTRRGTWYNIDNTVSMIRFESKNLLQEKMSYERIFTQSVISNYTFNSTTNKYRIIVYNGFTSNIEIVEGNFTDSTFTANNVNIIFGDTSTDNPFSRITISNIEDNSFVVLLEQSNDKGETWRPGNKLSYIRKE